MENFENKIVIITGSSSGIGAALAKELVRRGCVVIGLARRIEKLLALQAEIQNLPETRKGIFHFLQFDITDEQQIEETFKKIKMNFGIPSILINNAGVIIPKPFLETDGNTFDTIISTNARGLFLTTKVALKLMSENSTVGHILNMNSIAAHLPPLNDVCFPYAGSKHMVRIFSYGIRDMIEKNKWNIKISNISPGLVWTEMNEKNLNIQSIVSKILTVEDIVRACITILDTPPNVLISELIIEPMGINLRETLGEFVK